MFTGLVEDLGTLRVSQDRGGLRRLQIESSVVGHDLSEGDSVAINGACLTAVMVAADGFAVEAVPETLRRTNLGALAPGDPVNLERAMRADGRFGGHLVQGHVDTTITLRRRRPDGASTLVDFDLPADAGALVVPKGFVAVDGVSLTVVTASATGFQVALIPHTLASVTLGRAAPGYRANLEIDILAKYVQRLLAGATGATSPQDVSIAKLQEAGFMDPAGT